METKTQFTSFKREWLREALDIYNNYIKNTTVTFHIPLLTEPEMENILFFDDSRFESFGIFYEGTFAGYCIIALYKTRQAFACTTEFTIYLHPGFTGKGIGTKALNFLEAEALKREFHSAVGIISAENEGSIKLFAKNGYHQAAYFKEIGRKFNRYVDVVVYQKILSEE